MRALAAWWYGWQEGRDHRFVETQRVRDEVEQRYELGAGPSIYAGYYGKSKHLPRLPLVSRDPVW